MSCIEFYDVHDLCCCHVRIKKSNIYHRGHTVVQLVGALHYNLERQRFNPGGVIWIFHLAPEWPLG